MPLFMPFRKRCFFYVTAKYTFARRSLILQAVNDDACSQHAHIPTLLRLAFTQRHNLRYQALGSPAFYLCQTPRYQHRHAPPPPA